MNPQLVCLKRYRFELRFKIKLKLNNLKERESYDHRDQNETTGRL
jgi:hypothetical protein